MTDFPQKSDPGTMRHSSANYLFVDGLSNVTSDINGGPESLPFVGETEPLRQAREVISKVENQCVAEQAVRLLSIIGWMIKLVRQKRRDISDIPPLHAYVEEDGSVLMEWLFPDLRVGFNIEPNSEDSGWHVVSNKKAREFTASGQLTNPRELIAHLLASIMANI